MVNYLLYKYFTIQCEQNVHFSIDFFRGDFEMY